MTAPAPPANAPPTAQPMPTARPEEQPALTAALSRIGTGANRVHELTVELHPAELGAVHVRATLHGGTLDVTVSCADDTARQAVTAALPSLHSQLGSLGSVDVALAGPGTPARPSEPGAGQPHSQNPQQHPPDASPDDRRPPRRQRDDESFEQWM
jgi:flagellar hook-length control protein FliK